MILSGVGLVAKFKSEKARKTKNKPKNERKEHRVEEDGVVCEQCQIAAMRAKTHFQFPERHNSGTRRTSSGYGSIGGDSEQQNQLESIGELVTIATGEGHCIRVNLLYYTIDLQEENNNVSMSHFRKRVLQREVTASGEVETVVFSLDKDQDHYITTNRNKQLELNFFSDEPSLESPDERIFLVYTTNTNQKIIQPNHFKGFYLHHLDNRLDVTRFDINFRAPEEYFFQFDTVPDRTFILQPSPIFVCTHGRTYKQGEIMPGSEKVIKPKQMREKSSGFLSGLFLGCVSARSQKTREQTSGYI